MKSKEEILKTTEKVELNSYEFMGKLLNRLVRGLFVFKTRKGELVGASSTFFAIMSFCPLLILVISLYGKITGDLEQSYQYVMEHLKTNSPQIAPWIIENIEKIVKSQVLKSHSMNWLNIFLLIYTTSGFCGTLLFGLHTLGKVDSRGGKIVEDLKALLVGVTMGSFIVTLLMLNSEKSLVFSFLGEGGFTTFLKMGVRYSILPSLLSLGFFTTFLRWTSPRKISLKDAFLGACCFVTLFLLGKSFYWIYLHYFKAEIIQAFGNFHTITVAVLWVYYLFCSFYFSASVSMADSFFQAVIEENPEEAQKLPQIIDMTALPQVPAEELEIAEEEIEEASDDKKVA